ncbi:MAG: DUF5667 domain-containing protein, partial [Micromonosporaceae bacterium]
MIPNPIGRRRAGRFAQLLDEAEGGRRHHARSPYDEELAELVAVARTSTAQMSTVAAQVTADPAYRSRLRQRLLAVAATRGIGEDADAGHEPEPGLLTPSRRHLKLAVAVGATAGVLALSGVSTASGDAVPGDTLYTVKRQTERAQLALAGSDVNRGQLHLSFARTRLAEARAVADGPESLTAALDDMDADVRDGVRLLTGAAVERGDAGVLGGVDSFVPTQRRHVVDLVSSLGGESRNRALRSLELLDKVADRSAELRQSVLCTGQGNGYADSLGPVPQRCTALPDPGQPGVDGSGSESRTGSGDTTSRGAGTSDSPHRESSRPAGPSPSGVLPSQP